MCSALVLIVTAAQLCMMSAIIWFTIEGFQPYSRGADAMLHSRVSGLPHMLCSECKEPEAHRMAVHNAHSSERVKPNK